MSNSVLSTGYYKLVHVEHKNCLKYRLVNGHDESLGTILATDGDDGNLGWNSKVSRSCSFTALPSPDHDTSGR